MRPTTPSTAKLRVLALALACAPPFASVIALPAGEGTPPARLARAGKRARELLAPEVEPPTMNGTDGAACEGGGCLLASDASAEADGTAVLSDTAMVADAPSAKLNGTAEGDERAADAAADADETLATGGGAADDAPPGAAARAPLTPAPSDARVQTALCLQRLGREDYRFLRTGTTGTTAPEKVALLAVVLLVDAGVGLVTWLVLRLRGWAARKKAFMMLGGALLATTDGVTDVLLAAQWFRCGHTVWAAIALGCVGLNTLAALVFGAYVGLISGLDQTCAEKLGAAVTSVLQLGAVHAAVVRVWRGNHVDEVEVQPVLFLKLFEVALEAAPQVFVQGYVLLWLGAARASALSWVSLAVSIAGMGLVLGDFSVERMRLAGYGGASEAGGGGAGGRGGARWAARALAPVGVVSRALPIALFGCALGNWLAPPLLGAFAVLVALARYAVQKDKLGFGAWGTGLFFCFLFYAATPAMLMSDDTTALGEARIVAWTAAVELALGAAALGAPSPWRAAQPTGLLVGAACVFGACWLGRLGAAGVLLRAKAEKQRGGAFLLL